MNKKKLFFVGMTVLLGLTLLIGSVIKLGDWKLKKGLSFYVVFNFANGVLKNGPVMVSGVKLGKVREIEFINKNNVTKVRLNIWLEEKVKIKTNAKVYINQAGLMGEKYIEIDPGTDNYPNIKPGEVLIGQEPQKVEEVISGVVNVIKGLNKTIDGFNDVFVEKEVKASLRNSITNVSKTLENVSTIISENKVGINNGVEDFQKTLEMLKDSSITVKKIISLNEDKINESINKFQNFSKNLQSLSTKNYSKINETIADINKTVKIIKTTFIKMEPELIQFSKKINSSANTIDLILKNKKEEIESFFDNSKIVTKKVADILTENSKDISKSISNIKNVTSKMDVTLDLLKDNLQAIKTQKGLLGILVNDKELGKNAKKMGKDLSLTIQYLKHHPGILLNKNKFVSPEDYIDLEKKLEKERKKLKKNR